MPLKLLFVLAFSAALGALVCQYAGLRYPLSVTAGKTFDPIVATRILWAVEVWWLITNVYSLHLLHSTWKRPPGLLRVACAIWIPLTLYAQYFLGYRALLEIERFVELVDGPWK